MLTEIFSLKKLELKLRTDIKTAIFLIGITITGFLLGGCSSDAAESSNSNTPVPILAPTPTVIPTAIPTPSQVPTNTAEATVKIAEPTATIAAPTPEPTQIPELEVNEIVDSNMVFMAIPLNEQMAAEQAERFIEKFNTLKNDHNKQGIYIFETNTEVSWREILNGKYDKFIKSMFEQIKEKLGYQDYQGLIVPFPEPNEPIWNNADLTPAEISKLSNNFATLMHLVLENFRIGTLLNTETYLDHDWAKGNYGDLTAFTSELDKTQFVIQGYQGFAWIDKDTGKFMSDPNIFLNQDVILRSLNGSPLLEAWINTGIPKQVRLTSGKIVTLSFEQRLDVFKLMIENFKILTNNNIELTVNLFVEDKLDGPNDNSEGINWSWDPRELKIILNLLNQTGVRISLFQ